MGDIVARATQPALAAIKLAWWREQLQSLDEAAPPAEPRLEAVARELLPRGISGSQLAEIEPGWATLLDEALDPQLVADRGARIFAMLAMLLGEADPLIGEAGALWTLASVNKGERGLVMGVRRRAELLNGYRFPMRLRRLTVLARFAAHDLQRPSSAQPSKLRDRMIPALAHMWSGIAVTRA